MRVLVTGATGLIGGALVEGLVAEGVDVRAAHRAASDTRALDRLGVERAEADLGDPAALRATVRGCTHVVHLGAVRRGHPEAVARLNVAATATLAEAAAAEGAERFVFGSTCGVYGFVGRGPCDEASPLRPNTPYRRSKALAEQALERVAAATGLPVAIGRISSTVGPGASNWNPLIRSISGGSVRLIGDGSNRIHVAHVSEITDALWRCAVRPEAAGETFVLAGTSPVPFRAFAGAIAEAVGVAPPPRGVPAAPYVAACRAASWVFRRTGVSSAWLHGREIFVADKFYALDKMRDRLGAAPMWTMEAAVAEMVGAWNARC